MARSAHGVWVSVVLTLLVGGCGGAEPSDLCVGVDCSLLDDECQAGACDPATGACELQPRPDQTSCDDGSFCTVGEACAGGACSGGSALDCDDADDCTVDACDEATDACTHTAVPGGMPCDEPPDLCADVDCSPLDDACRVGVCEPATGVCVTEPRPDDTACDDGAFCTTGETCVAGACSGGAATNCADASECTADACDEAADACTHTAVLDDTPCDDGLFCTSGDACSAGACTGGVATDCADANGCTVDACDEVANSCLHTDRTGPCSDGRACTTADVCQAGFCMGVPVAITCGDGNDCTVDACTEPLGVCTNTIAVDGTRCDDGQFCTSNDACSVGACLGITPRDCSDAESCTADACNEATDRCTHTAVGDGTPCDDGDSCASDDVCDRGTCAPGLAVSDGTPCNDGEPCSSADICDTGTCTPGPALSDGTPCDDGYFCSSDDTCDRGTCKPGPATDCDDSDVTTVDACDEVSDVCSHL